MNVFDIIGPIMIGPSSSHTAGACRIGNYARELLGEDPKSIEIFFSGSFARTYMGHGTDKAVVAGILGFSSFDERLRDSINIAKEKGIDIKFENREIELAHPNTAHIIATKKDGEVVDLIGASIGGGAIQITSINGTKVNIDGVYDTLIVKHKDVPGMIAKITKILYDSNINVNGLNLYRTKKKGDAVVIVQVDDDIINEDVISKLKIIENVSKVVLLRALI